MQFKELTTEAQLLELANASHETPQIIFKHSTRCSISSMALGRVQKAPDVPGADAWLLDLVRFRPVSNAVAQTFGVQHESPQVLVIKNGECVYDESHMGIRADAISEAVLD